MPLVSGCSLLVAAGVLFLVVVLLVLRRVIAAAFDGHAGADFGESAFCWLVEPLSACPQCQQLPAACRAWQNWTAAALHR